MKKILKNIPDFFRANGKFIVFLLPIVLHQMTLLEPSILSNLILVIILWFFQKYIFSVCKYEDKKIDYIFFGGLTFYLAYLDGGFLIFSVLTTLHFIYQKARLKKYWALALYCLGAAVPIGLCIYQYDFHEGIGFIETLWAYYPNVLPENPREYILVAAGVFVFLTGLLNRFYMIIALVYLWVGLATATQNFVIASLFIGLLSFTATWKIEKRLT